MSLIKTTRKTRTQKQHWNEGRSMEVHVFIYSTFKINTINKHIRTPNIHILIVDTYVCMYVL